MQSMLLMSIYDLETPGVASRDERRKGKVGTKYNWLLLEFLY